MTNPSTPNPKNPPAHVCSSSFTAAGKRITVTMIHPATDAAGENVPFFDGGQFTGGTVQDVTTEHGRVRRRVGMTHTPATWGKLWDTPPEGFTKPVEVVGNYCPATFRVDGLTYSVTFRTGIELGEYEHTSKRAQGRVVINSLTVEGRSVERKRLANIPTAALLEHALHASTFIATAYPANYSTALDGQAFFDSGPTVWVEPHTVGVRPRTTKDMRDLKGLKSPGRKSYASAWHTSEMIDAAVEYWNACPKDHPGGRTEYVRVQLDLKFCHTYAPSTISRMFAKAREEGKLPPVPEKYKYRRTTGGTK